MSLDLELSSTRPDDASRVPPQDIDAEKSVVGAMMISKDAIAEVVEVLRPEDFYRPAHESIFSAILDLYSRGEPADAVTVGDELAKRGDLGRIGGPAYIHDLISAVPTAANAGFYGQIVKEKATMRRLVDAGTRIAQMGYEGTGDADDIVNAAQSEMFKVGESRASEDYVAIADIIETTMDEIEAYGHRGSDMAGVPTGFVGLDDLTNGLHAGQMIVLAGRPAMGKSTLGVDLVRSAALRHGMTSVIFSLEMGRTELMMRVLAAEAGVRLDNMRKGNLSDSEFTQVARTMGRIKDAPLFIDDSANMSLMQIRTKCRRLKQRHGLRLIMIDYLQLLSSGKRVESRQQEVSEFSRALKLLAKELEVPVIAISQLNRGPEQRTDRRPQMSDLRESGCLTAETTVLRADTGAEVTLGELHHSGATEIPVWALDESLRYQRRHLTHVFPTGHREVFRLCTSSGKTVDATANHPFLTAGGWMPLRELTVGTPIATPRHVPAPDNHTSMGNAAVTNLATRIAANDFHLIPDHVFSLPKHQIARFLSCVWSENATVQFPDGDSPVVQLNVAPTVGDGLSRLLLRFGISVTKHISDGRALLQLVDDDDLRRFTQEIGFTRCDETQQQLMQYVHHVATDDEGDPDPPVAIDVRRLERAMAHAGAIAEVSLTGDVQTLREPLLEVQKVLDDADFDLYATNDVVWDAIESIKPLGTQDVYDATVVGGHNFIANGIAVHNSIEQDADMVILLHREDYYDAQNRPGEGDFIVAKHRNGPTGTVAVAFQGHYCRFSDMEATNSGSFS